MSSSFSVTSTSGRTACSTNSSSGRRRRHSSPTMLTVARSMTSRPSPMLPSPPFHLGKPLSSSPASRLSPLFPRLQRGPAPPCGMVKKEMLLQDVCSFLSRHCDVSYVGPSTRLADLAAASARKTAEERRQQGKGLLGLAASLVGRAKKKEEEGQEDKDGSSSASSSSPPSPRGPSAVEVEEALVDLFLSLERRFDLPFGDEKEAANAVTVADASALLAREIELVNESLMHIEID